MKKYAVKSNEGKFLRVKRSSGYKIRSWVDKVWDATLFNRKSDASQTSPVHFNKDMNTVVEVEVRVKLSK